MLRVDFRHVGSLVDLYTFLFLVCVCVHSLGLVQLDGNFFLGNDRKNPDQKKVWLGQALTTRLQIFPISIYIYTT